MDAYCCQLADKLMKFIYSDFKIRDMTKDIHFTYLSRTAYLLYARPHEFDGYADINYFVMFARDVIANWDSDENVYYDYVDEFIHFCMKMDQLVRRLNTIREEYRLLGILLQYGY